MDYKRDFSRVSSPNPPFVQPSPYDRLVNYFHGTPIPSTSTDQPFNGIECKEVTRYARDTFDAIRALDSARKLENEKRSAEDSNNLKESKVE